MATITDYASLQTAINDWADRSDSSGTLDGYIQLAEAEFNLVLRSHRRETSATLTTDANGEVSLPAGFREMRSIVRDYSGALPLIPVSWPQLIAMNPYAEGADPIYYAIRGTTLKVAPIIEDDFIAVYEAALSGLSGSNTTNWLLTLAPQAYLFMCVAMLEGRLGQFERAAVFKSQALEILASVGIQSDLAQFGAAGIEFENAVP